MMVQIIQLRLKDGRTITAIVPKFCDDTAEAVVVGISVYEAFEDPTVSAYHQPQAKAP